MISPNRCLHNRSENEFLSLILSAKRLPPVSNYQQVIELNLSNLQLIRIDSFPFESFPRLRSLDFSYNQLRSIQPDWAKLKPNAIESLNLTSNQLETLLFLKDFSSLKFLNVSNNPLRKNERFLSLYLCPTLEQLIDNQIDHVQTDRSTLNHLLQLMNSDIDPRQYTSDEYRETILRRIGNESQFPEFQRSPIGNHLIEKKIYHYRSFFKKNFAAQLTEDFSRALNLKETAFQPAKFIRVHHHSEDMLTRTPVMMCAFEPNTSDNILATCGGSKVCFINCDSGEVTHVFHVKTLTPPVTTTTKLQKKEPKKIMSMDYFSCLCWIEIHQPSETLKILAVGATNGHIYLLCPKWKLMFGHVELTNSFIQCLTWHSSDPLTLVIGSYNTVRCISMRSYINRLQSFIRKQSKPSVPYDYVDTTLFLSQVSTTNLYHLDAGGNGTLILVTDLLFIPASKKNPLLLLVGTTSGLFLIRYREKQEDNVIQLALPTTVWTASTYIESLSFIELPTPMIAMTAFGLDQICCFNVDQALQDQQIQLIYSFPNPSRQFPTKMTILQPSDHRNPSFECAIGSHYGSVYHHQLRLKKILGQSKANDFDHSCSELSYAANESAPLPCILSSSINPHYLAFTTTNNLICLYQRQ